MKIQISRESYTGLKRYSGVFLQQGRMITDADWNEAVEISRRRLDDALADIVVSGVPRENGMRMEATAGQPLRLRRGRVYANGVGGLVTGTNADPTQPFGLNQQTDFPLPDAVTPPATNYRLYADLWERSVTSLEDEGQLRDPAFHGADTAARTQTMAQLKWCDAGVDPENATINPRIGDAKATLTLRSQLAGLDPCDPCAREISVPSRVGNYLFRVEVHKVEGTPKNPSKVVLKWSSENGAEHHAVGTEPSDFKGTDWVYEYYTTRTEKHLGVHLSGGITPLVGQLEEGFPDAAPDGFDFVRRWDGYCTISRSGGNWSLDDGRERGIDLSTGSASDADGHVSLASNAFSAQLATLTLELTLTNQTTFVAGDYWLAAVRESVHASGDVVLDEAPPVGVLHSYLLLGTIDASGVFVAPDTNRQQKLDFPSLTTLAAKDVDYTANCPSGLFNASHDTVQKALDRVCGIDATHVAFAKPCDTSIYKGVDPATINTVAKALALLCNVRADQISYTNDPTCSTLAGATTVQQALHLLCMKESKGGCRTTIGVGGEFPTLKAAVDAALQLKKTDFCFCLLPGDHVIAEPLILTPPSQMPHHFALEGCGSASRLRVAAELAIRGFSTIRFSELSMEVEPVPSVDLQADEVTIEDCVIFSEDNRQPPVSITAASALRLTDNNVQALRKQRLKVAREIFADLAPKSFFSETLRKEDVTVQAAETAKILTTMPAAQRKKVGTTIEKQLTDRVGASVAKDKRLESSETAAFRSLARLLSSDSRDIAVRLEKELVNLRDVLMRAEASLAIVVEGAPTLVEITGNFIIGVVSLYGRPGELTLSDANLKKLQPMLVEAQIGLAAEEETLLVARNHISQITIGGELVIRLRDAIQQGAETQIDGLFRTARLTDNVFSLGENNLLCVEATLSGNRFAGGDKRIGTVIANFAYYVGNHGGTKENVPLLNLAPRWNNTAWDELNNVFIRNP